MKGVVVGCFKRAVSSEVGGIAVSHPSLNSEKRSEPGRVGIKCPASSNRKPIKNNLKTKKESWVRGTTRPLGGHSLPPLSLTGGGGEVAAADLSPVLKLGRPEVGPQKGKLKTPQPFALETPRCLCLEF
ncbi:hypothetical protein NDU88_002842 [Pleurodeles waltl]|uniref:Uncharacterized protein n=1 Tax=Pleurodeles waltl TaxID=8319 RepID=A0AAV7UAR7_PLEWA|nr:hypothetical protein NDU88_002842 [Pleurodeles waltl]